MVWKVYLEGDESDLSVLARTFPTGDPFVGADESREAYYLASDSIGDASIGPDVERAVNLLHRVNGITRTLHGGFRPARLSNRYQSPEGAEHVLLHPAAIEIRSMAFGAVTVAGFDSEQESDGQRFARVAESNPDVANAVRIMGQADELDWYDAFKVYETVRASVGGDVEIIARRWSTSTELKRFRLSANHPAISGDAARHAQMRGSPDLKDAMTLAEGRALAGRLVEQWIRSQLKGNG